MQKKTKAGIAVAGAAALLLGGLGTTALWSDSATSSGSQVQTGHLTISHTESTQFTDQDGQTFNEGDTLVPGDVITSTQTFDVDALGKNLKANVEATYVDGEDGALPEGVTVDVNDITLAGDPFDPATQQITAGDDQVLTAEVVITVDPSIGGTDAQDTPINIDNVQVSVTQVR